MEQQTIIITKAGIQATLNARASILAAANPLYGRYDKSKSLRWNVDMTAPIMSRFDLFFVVLDECQEDVDNAVARHIVDLHMGGDRPVTCDYSIDQMQKYIRVARLIKPTITPESRKLLVKFYKKLRQQDAEENKAYRFTVRQLESMIRLAEAMARAHLDEEVIPAYVKEAARLLKQSIISVDNEDIRLDIRDMKIDEEGEVMEDDGEKADNSLTFQEYTQMVNKLVRRIRQEETPDSPGVRQEEAENFLLDEYSGQLDEADIVPFMEKVQCVIERLIHVDRILLVHTEAEENKDRVIEVHPNYDIETDLSTHTKKADRETQEDMERAARKKARDEALEQKRVAAEAQRAREGAADVES